MGFHYIDSEHVPVPGCEGFTKELLVGILIVGDEVYLLQIKAGSKRYNRILPNDISKYRKQPKDELLPILDVTPVAKKELDYFPDGVYVQVSSIADVFAAQGLNPVRLILELNAETRYVYTMRVSTRCSTRDVWQFLSFYWHGSPATHCLGGRMLSLRWL